MLVRRSSRISRASKETFAASKKKRSIPRKVNGADARRRSLRLGSFLGLSMVALNPSASPPKRKSFAALVRSNNAVSTPTTDRIRNEEIDTDATKPLSPGTLARFRADAERERLNMNDTWITSDEDASDDDDDE